MAPPELAADAPVLDVVHPLKVGLGPALRNEAGPAVFHGANRRLRERADLHVPLVGEPRLEHRLAPITAWHGRGVRLGFLEQPLCLERRDHAFARCETIETAQLRRNCGEVRGGIGDDSRVLVEDIEDRQLMSPADLVVIEVMSGRHLQRTGAERRIDVLVGDDRNQPSASGAGGRLRPISERWRSSSGCTATAVSPSMVSGRVVATTTWPEPSASG